MCRNRAKPLIYRLKLSVLEEALLGFAGTFGMRAGNARPDGKPIALKKGTTP